MFKEIGKWFERLSLQAKIIITSITGFIAFAFYLFVQGKINLRSSFKYKLEKVRSDLKIKKLKKDEEQNAEEIKILEDKEKQILEKIKFVEEKEASGEEVTIEDLDKFFEERGF